MSLVALLAAVTVQTFPAAEAVAQPGCLQDRLQHARLYRQDKRIGARKLTDLPKVQVEHAVVRSVQGCAVRSIVSFDAEAAARAPRPTRAGALSNRR